MTLDSKIPPGPLPQKWDRYRAEVKLVNPASKRKLHIIIVGSGLAGASAAATLADLGYSVEVFTFQDSPRRADSIAAQGGINAAKNYQNDGDSIERLYYDTIKGGDFRSREANVYRLAQVSVDIIDQCVAQGVPFAREYGGLLANRSFGGAQVSRTFYCRGQTGQQLLLGAYSALSRHVGLGTVKLHTRAEMLDVVVSDGRAVGIVTRDLISGKIEGHTADAVILATGGYTNVYYLSTNASGCNVTATWRAYRRGAYFANPCYTQIHPTCIPVHGEHQKKLTLMSESLRNDGRVWVPKKKGDKRPAAQIPESERDYYLERRYPSYGNLAPRDVASRAAKVVCDEGYGVGESGRGVFLDFADAINRLGRKTVEERYGNLFDMYAHITSEDPYAAPMRIYPAPHYTMGGLWVDYNLMSNVPGLFVLGEANFSDHGANRLGASALMQGLADGYFVIPYTIGQYFATVKPKRLAVDHADFVRTGKEVQERIARLLGVKGKQSAAAFHHRLGLILWENCGMARTQAGLEETLRKIPALREEFWQNVSVTGSGQEMNMALEYAGRVADFLEFGELMCRDALTRNESCGAHFREEFQTPEGEPLRNDAEFSFVSAWQFGSADNANLAPRTSNFRACQALREELQIMNFTLHIWRQKGPNEPGRMVEYPARDVSPDTSFLEMLDEVNEAALAKGEETIAYEYDCREGICGACSLVINGKPHGPGRGVTTCQVYMRSFTDGDHIFIEPWRARAFPVIKDLVVDRSSFDRIIQAGGFISVSTGGAPDGNDLPVPKPNAELAMDAAECIGCGACAAACKNASAMLFVSAKVAHLGLLPQGQPERTSRVRKMVEAMDNEGFGSCTNQRECEAVCPKDISYNFIGQMNRDYLKSLISTAGESGKAPN